MLLEDRVLTTDELRRQADLRLEDADILLPAGIVESLEDLAFHMVIPSGRAHGGDLERLVVQLVLDTTAGQVRIDTMVEDDWFALLPTSFEVLRTVRELVPEAVQLELTSASDDEPF